MTFQSGQGVVHVATLVMFVAFGFALHVGFIVL